VVENGRQYFSEELCHEHETGSMTLKVLNVSFMLFCSIERTEGA